MLVIILFMFYSFNYDKLAIDHLATLFSDSVALYFSLLTKDIVYLFNCLFIIYRIYAIGIFNRDIDVLCIWIDIVGVGLNEINIF